MRILFRKKKLIKFPIMGDIEKIKKLRILSGAGFKDCSTALDESKDDIDKALHNLNILNESSSGYEVSTVKKELQEVMQNYFGVFRRGDYMEKGVAALNGIREKIENLHLIDKSAAFNTNRVEAIELQNLFEVAEATAISSLQRTESRGAHAREDLSLIHI